jgi:hypothetical protein
VRDQEQQPQDEKAALRRAPGRESADAAHLGTLSAQVQGPLSPMTVLALQRTVGNAAVVRLLEQRRQVQRSAPPGTEREARRDVSESDAPPQRDLPPHGHTHAPVQRMPRTRPTRTRTRTSAPTAASALTATNVVRREEEGPVGSFQRTRKWAVNPCHAGLIVQKVTRAFAVDLWDASTTTWNRMTPGQIDTYTNTYNPGSTSATVVQYWEAWLVGPTGRVSDGGDDTFGLCSIIPDATTINDTTRGTYTIRGEATFYPTTSRPTDIFVTGLGLPRGGAALSNGLLSSLTDPSTAIAAAVTAGTLGTGTPTVNCRAVVTWDSSTAVATPDPYSSVAFP